jgi:hypothetical protein
MSDPVRFTDAVRLLGENDSSVLERLDKLAGGILLGTAIPTQGATLALITPKNEFFRLLKETVEKRSNRWRKYDVRTRQDLIIAAHTIIVVDAYFETVTKYLNTTLDAIGITGEDQVRLLTAAAGKPANSTGDFLSTFAGLNVPAPSPMRGFDNNLIQVKKLYENLAAPIEKLLHGLAVWDELDDTDKRELSRFLYGQAIDDAAGLYTSKFVELAAKAPEFFIWAVVTEFRHTSTGLTDLDRQFEHAKQALDLIRTESSLAFEGMRGFLERVYAGPEAAKSDLDQLNTSFLGRPLLDLDVEEEGVPIHAPTIQAGYVRPNYRKLAYERGLRISDEDLWTSRESRHNLQEFMTGLLTHSESRRRPVLLLGQPGAGKTLLVKILAASLPGDKFTPIVVRLRNVSASAPIQQQIEDALYQSLGRRINYAEFVSSRPEALPVILLDGFDELLQASGRSGTNYLEQVKSFQERETDLKRGVAILVTSRTVVADHARVPDGTAVIRLDPFEDDQIREWVKVWNNENRGYFRTHALQALDADSLITMGDLARQPLVLAMLAVFDAVANDLTRQDESLGQAVLYEKLLTLFLRREVRRQFDVQDSQHELALIEQHLGQLSIAAFAMFNRGAQHCSQEELTADLATLQVDTSEETNSSGDLDPGLRPGLRVFGRFFFVVESKAQLGKESTIAVYEFLHATFGEYLIAREIAKELESLAEQVHAERRPGRPPLPIDDSWLSALCSHHPLLDRIQLLDFFQDIVSARENSTETARIRDCLNTLLRFPTAPSTDPSGSLASYNPSGQARDIRSALYSFNLFCLRWWLADTSLMLDDLAPTKTDALTWWRTMCRKWYAAVGDPTWVQFLGTVGISIEDGSGQLDRDPKLPGSVRDAPPEIQRTYMAAGHLGEPLQVLILELAAIVASIFPDYLTGDGKLDRGIEHVLRLRLFSRSTLASLDLPSLHIAALAGLRSAPEPRSSVSMRLELLGRQLKEDIDLMSSDEVRSCIDATVDATRLESTAVGYLLLLELMLEARHKMGAITTDLGSEVFARVDFTDLLGSQSTQATRMYLDLLASKFEFPTRTIDQSFEGADYLFERVNFAELICEDDRLVSDLLRLARRRRRREWAGRRAYPALRDRLAAGNSINLSIADWLYCAGSYVLQSDRREAAKEAAMTVMNVMQQLDVEGRAAAGIAGVSEFYAAVQAAPGDMPQAMEGVLDRLERLAM